ncbi:MAG: hypothetical protein P8L68_01240 [Paracoccaceae bacterium]|nr:hypothetical protein [Paracoccaceae bacterium]MDG2257104.1 hypothetical protein [Paracoccaceae bacterium]
MPHAELKYSSDLGIDAPKILRAIEECINDHDPNAGACKGRAYLTDIFHHTHILVDISMLPKPHRDTAFTVRLRDDLEHLIKGCLTKACKFSLAITFTDQIYITNEFVPEAYA